MSCSIYPAVTPSVQNATDHSTICSIYQQLFCRNSPAPCMEYPMTLFLATYLHYGAWRSAGRSRHGSVSLPAEHKVSFVRGPHDHFVHRVSLRLHPCLRVVHRDASPVTACRFHRPVLLLLTHRRRKSLLFGSHLIVWLSVHTGAWPRP